MFLIIFCLLASIYAQIVYIPDYVGINSTISENSFNGVDFCTEPGTVYCVQPEACRPFLSCLSCTNENDFRGSDNECSSSWRNTKCSESTKIRCYDGSCPADPKKVCTTSDYCPTQINQYPDFKCYTSQQEPTIPRCPPSSLYCDDQLSCYIRDAYSECHYRYQQDVCQSSVLPLMCRDFKTCVSSPNNCPSEIKCNDNEYLCPDHTCVTSPSLCRYEYSFCEEDSYKCPDTTCRSIHMFDNIIPPIPPSELYDMAIKSCPSMITCPGNYKLCEDGLCIPNDAVCGKTYSCRYNQYRCGDGTCSESRKFCGTRPMCPLVSANSSYTYFMCNDGQCVTTLAKCPTPKTCKSNEIYCAGVNKCILFELERCPVITRCPSSRPIKCSNNECVDRPEKCKEININCPSNAPFRCNDGRCVINQIHCSSDMFCPYDRPILCPDYKCVDDESKCKVIPIECPDNQYLCNGKCVSSFYECPQLPICREDAVLCPNMKCVEYNITDRNYYFGDRNDGYSMCINRLLSTKYSSFCDSNTQIGYAECINSYTKMAEDECIHQHYNYPCTEIQDNDCKDYNCIDGSCVTNSSYCPTPIICSINSPYLCPDGTCTNNPMKCPKPSYCGNTMYTCPDGSCALIKSQCGTPLTCPVDKPIRCWNNECKQNINDCTNDRKCVAPTPFMCYNGQCVSERMNCPLIPKCPEDAPICLNGICTSNLEEYTTNITCIKPLECPEGMYMCENGECVSSLSECEQLQCPLSVPYRCKDQSCSLDKSLCNSDDNLCKEPYPYIFTCYDKSIICCPQNISCCPRGFCPKGEVLCDNGLCATDKTICKNQINCPLLLPYKCSDGSCVHDLSYCIYHNSCPFGYKRCADGMCVETTLDCSLQYNSSNYCHSYRPFLCADGSCKTSFDACKIIPPCPKGYFRCNNNRCVYNESSCIKYDNCPSYVPYRCKKGIDNGKCVANPIDCRLDNGCPILYPKRCPRGLCVFENATCKNKIQTLCGDNKYRCWNDKCVDNPSQCFPPSICPFNTPFRCPNGDCVINALNCSKPAALLGSFLCSNGELVNYPSQCKEIHNCTNERSMYCLDGRCIQSSTRESNNECKVHFFCPEYSPILCDNGECVSDEKNCGVRLPCDEGLQLCGDGSCSTNCSIITECPVSAPIKCPNGRCTKSIPECFDANKCKVTEYLCWNGECTEHPLLCSKGLTCRNGEILCWNGMCASSYDKCSILPTCNQKHPIRCSTGECVSSLSNCPNNTEEYDYPIKNIQYNGCAFNQIQCSDWKCYDLVNVSTVPCLNNTKEYTCFASIYKEKDPLKCYKYQRETIYFGIKVYIRPGAEYQIPLIYVDGYETISLSVYTGFNLLYSAVLDISPIARSKLFTTHNYVHISRLNDYPPELDMSDTLFLGAFKVIATSKQRSDSLYSTPIVITAMMPVYYYNNTKIELEDLCLASLNNGNWECEDTLMNAQKMLYSARIKHDGIYSIIFNPHHIPYYTEEFKWKDIHTIIVVFAVVLIMFIFIIYKLHQRLRRIKELEKRRELFDVNKKDVKYNRNPMLDIEISQLNGPAIPFHDDDDNPTEYDRLLKNQNDDDDDDAVALQTHMQNIGIIQDGLEVINSQETELMSSIANLKREKQIRSQMTRFT